MNAPKTFLLIAGDFYYPSSGTGDWINTFSSKEDAENAVETINPQIGPLWQENNTPTKYKINDMQYDWYEIIDLNDWM